jgi:hypothetical protein
MNISPNLGRILLASYLILIGLSGTFAINLGQLNVLAPLLALAAGGLLLFGR